jgi:hypothetical protein
MRRKRSRSLGAPAAEDDKILGVSKPLFFTGLAAAVTLAYLNSGDGNLDAATNNGSGGTTTGGGSTPTKTTPTKTTTTKPTTSVSPDFVKPYRKPLNLKASPLLYVFVNSLGGEGIFDRLKFKATLLDGNGLDRITTLDNHEFAGWATGAEWISDSLDTYIQLYQQVGKIGYNYWIAKSQTQAMHAQAAEAAYGQLFNVSRMTTAHESDISAFYFNNYTL